jgi:hypothetical protein
MAANDAGTLFYAAVTQPDPSMEMVTKLFADFQKSEVTAKECRVMEADCHLN